MPRREYFHKYYFQYSVHISVIPKVAHVNTNSDTKREADLCEKGIKFLKKMWCCVGGGVMN